MSFDAINDLNWPAVLVAGLAYFILGALWYSKALFGRPWMRSVGWDPDQAPPQMSPMSYVAPLVSYLIAAAAVGMLTAATGTATAGAGVILGLVLGIGVAGTLLSVTAVFDPQKRDRNTWFAVTAGYHLVGLVVTAVILAVWN